MRSNRGEASIGTVIFALFISAILMFGVPLMIISSKSDDAAGLSAQSATTDLKDKVVVTGYLTQEDYDNYILTLASSEHAYDVEITIQKLDDNPSKKSTGSTVTIGDKVYYVMYTTQVLDELAAKGQIKLNPGDNITIKAQNTDATIFDQIKATVFRSGNDGTSAIVAQDSGMVN